MNRMHRKKLSVAVMNALNAGVVAGLATPLAYAQQTPPAEPQKIERIEVTGSRIPSPTLTSESPVNVISAQDIAWTGLTSTSDILNQLPQVTAGQGSNRLERRQRDVATVDLRGLGRAPHAGADRRQARAGGRPDSGRVADQHQRHSEHADPARRSAVGRRVVDLRIGRRRRRGQLHHERPLRGRPARLELQRLQPPAEQLDGRPRGQKQADATRHSSRSPATSTFDGNTQSFSVTMGSNFANGKGNATIFFEWRNQDAVLQSQRDHSACSLSPASDGAGEHGSEPNRERLFLRRLRHELSRDGSRTSATSTITIANAAGDVRNLRQLRWISTTSRRPTTSSAPTCATCSTRSCITTCCRRSGRTPSSTT